MTWLEPIDQREARRFATAVRHQANSTREDVSDQLASLARHTRNAVEPHLRHARDVVRHEAPIVADAALKQATRMARAARRDPVPVAVGAIGLVLLASLILGRRRT